MTASISTRVLRSIPHLGRDALYRKVYVQGMPWILNHHVDRIPVHPYWIVDLLQKIQGSTMPLAPHFRAPSLVNDELSLTA